MKVKNKFKSGAASFYVVAFSTLILVIIASSFASAIIMEVTRSSNDDLAQSAYDAALAGIEDAKTAFINYQNCLTAGAPVAEPDNNGTVSCAEIRWWMGDRNDSSEGGTKVDCNMVGHILGRIAEDEEGEVKIAETAGGGDANNNLQQAYTCVIVQSKLSDYRADLNLANPYRVVKIKLGDKIRAKDIGAVKVSWYSYRDGGLDFNYNNIVMDETRVGFQSMNLTDPATPPTLGVQLVQTANTFSLEQLNGKTIDNKTDRAMVYLVPTKNSTMAGGNRGEIQNDWSYIGAYDGNENTLTATQVASTNDHSKNYPYAVFCPESSSNEYACSATINLPEPIGGERSDETFMFVISLPYGQPDTDFSLELICKDGVSSCGGDESGSNVAELSGMQVMIDSTGRANDLYRRLEVRFEPMNNAFNFPLYAVQVDEEFEKMLRVTKECYQYNANTGTCGNISDYQNYTNY